MPKISIVILTYNHLEDLLKPCLASIFKYTDLTDIEIIVVANGCKDGTNEYLLNNKQVKSIILEKNIGGTRAGNLAMKDAQGEFIIGLGDDTVLLEQPKNQWIEMLLNPFLDDKVMITGPMIGNCSETGREFVILFCCMIRKSLFDVIGMIDETFADCDYGSDIDFSIKAQNLGYKIIQVPNESKKYYAQNRMTGSFPIYHIGNATYSKLKDWNNDSKLKDGRAIIRERYLTNNKKEEVMKFKNPFRQQPREEQVKAGQPEIETAIILVQYENGGSTIGYLNVGGLKTKRQATMNDLYRMCSETLQQIATIRTAERVAGMLQQNTPEQATKPIPEVAPVEEVKSDAVVKEKEEFKKEIK